MYKIFYIGTYFRNPRIYEWILSWNVRLRSYWVTAVHGLPNAKPASARSKPILRAPDSLPLGLNIVQNKTNWPEGPAIIQKGTTMHLSESNIQA